MITYTDIRELVDAHVAAEKRHDPDAAASFYAEDSYYEHVPTGVRHVGRQAVRDQYASTWALVEGFDFDVEGTVAEGDWLVQWGRFTGTVAGRPIDAPFMARFETRNGQIVGESVLYDLLTVAEQAGLDPAVFKATGELKPA